MQTIDVLPKASRRQAVTERRVVVLLCLAVWLLVALMLTGCASGTTPTQGPLVAVPAAHPTVRASLLQPCSEVDPAADGQLVTLLSNHVDVALALAACRTSKADLVDAIKGQIGIDIVQ